MQLISKFNKGIWFLLCVVDSFSKYTWIVPSKDKKGVTIVHAFQKILNDSMKLHSKGKPKKIWLYKGNEFDKNSFKEC